MDISPLRYIWFTNDLFFEKITKNIFRVFWEYKNNFEIFSQFLKKYKYLKRIFSVFEKINFFFIFSRLKWKNNSKIFSRWDTFCPALDITVPVFGTNITLPPLYLLMPSLSGQDIGRGPGMNGTFIMMGSRYEWNIFQDEVMVWVERWWKMRSMYEWNIEQKGVQVWVERFKIFQCRSCKIRSLLVESDWTIRFVFSLRIISAYRSFDRKWPEVNIYSRKGIWKFWSVPLIPWPHLEKCSTHTLTPSLWMFHSYLNPLYL